MNLLNLEQMRLDEILDIIKLAQEFENETYKKDYQGSKTIANLFFEPSTRTHYSFEMAELKLGCKTINFEESNSSTQKGETLYDTLKTFESIGVDALVVRHTQEEYYNKLLGKINIPIINGGDGKSNHPSQTLLDLYTIYKEYGKFEGLKVCIVGDIKYSRVAHSNIAVMERLGMEVITSGPKEYCEEKYQYTDLDTAVKTCDIIMLLRVQNERHDNLLGISEKEYNEKYGMNIKRVNQMIENSIIMHPAPFNRNVELTDEVVECDKSRIFAQMKNGVYTRMAILETILK